MRDFCTEAFLLLKARNEKISFAESLTGGLIAASFVGNPGASSLLDESYVTYAAESKIRILGVKRETVENPGVVSAQCAMEMAEGVRTISGACWGVSATGLAGPDGGTAALPVGTVFIGISSKQGTRAHECHFNGDRLSVRTQAVQKAFELLIREMSLLSPGSLV